MDRPHAEDGKRLVIGGEDAGARLDRLLADWCGLSRAAVLRLLDTSAVSLNGRAAARRDKGRPLCAGDTLEIAGPFVRPEAPRADPSTPLKVLAEGDGWLAVDKPPGVPVRPHGLDETGTILNAVIARFPQLAGIGEGGLRSGVVHRLDNDTSGVMLVATDQPAWGRLRQAFTDHRIRKRYLALVHGQPADTGESVMHLRVARHAPAHVKVFDSGEAAHGVRRCSLAWRVVERLGVAGCLIEIDLHTGFLHQARVMTAALGHPVVGDAQYGDGLPLYGAHRHMLHAASVEFEDIFVEAPLPEDFASMLNRLRREAR